jgi:Raf kinase inhibitor-like YbhB/YbcL family protein
MAGFAIPSVMRRANIATLTAVAVAILLAIGDASGAGFMLASDKFADGEPIPVEATCDGADHSPILQWDGAPDGTKAYALVVDDPDASGGSFVHWILYNVPAAARSLGGAMDTTPKLGDGSMQGKNGFGKTGYSGPCPPRGPKHHYVFTLYALSDPLDLEPGATIDALLAAIKPKKLAQTKLTGTYARASAQSG